MATELPDGGRAVDVRAAGERQPEQAGDLVEGLARGVVDGLAERLDGGGDVLDAQQRGVAAADEQREARVGQRAVLELVDGDVGGEVVDAVQRLAEPDRQRLGRGHADEQRAGQAGAAGHGDRVDLVQRARRRSRRPAPASGPSPRGARGWPPPAPRRRSGRAPRRCWRRRRRAACGRARSRRRSRRTRSRSPGPVVRSSQLHHDRGGAVAVVARPAVQLHETTRGVELQRAPRCPRGPPAAPGPPSVRSREHGVEERGGDAGTPPRRGDADPLQLDHVAGHARDRVADDRASSSADEVVHGRSRPATPSATRPSDQASAPRLSASEARDRRGVGLGGGADVHETRLGPAGATASGRRR